MKKKQGHHSKFVWEGCKILRNIGALTFLIREIIRYNSFHTDCPERIGAGWKKRNWTSKVENKDIHFGTYRAGYYCFIIVPRSNLCIKTGPGYKGLKKEYMGQGTGRMGPPAGVKMGVTDDLGVTRREH